MLSPQTTSELATPLVDAFGAKPPQRGLRTEGTCGEKRTLHIEVVRSYEKCLNYHLDTAEKSATWRNRLADCGRHGQLQTEQEQFFFAKVRPTRAGDLTCVKQERRSRVMKIDKSDENGADETE